MTSMAEVPTQECHPVQKKDYVSYQIDQNIYIEIGRDVLSGLQDVI